MIISNSVINLVKLKNYLQFFVSIVSKFIIIKLLFKSIKRVSNILPMNLSDILD